MNKVIGFDHDGPCRDAAAVIVSAGDGRVVVAVPIVEQPEPAQRGSDGGGAVADIPFGGGGFRGAVIGRDQAGWVAEEENGGYGVKESVWQDGGVGGGSDR